MMVYFRKLLPESIFSNCNERIIRHGLNIIRSAESEDDENDNMDIGLPSRDQSAQAGSDKASSNQGTLLTGITPFGGQVSVLNA
jgi:IS5 family transposase